jgi:hypothetical protein
MGGSDQSPISEPAAHPLTPAAEPAPATTSATTEDKLDESAPGARAVGRSVINGVTKIGTAFVPLSSP